jgi:hemerythrin
MEMEGKSELVNWSPTFSVGVKLVDDQHKGLLNLVNDLFNHVIGNEEAEKAYFQKVIQEAVQYIKVHLATEEKIMLAAKFPGYAEHKRAHDSFVLTVINNIKDFEAGKRLTLATFTRFLKEWILTHIAIMDKQYFEYFKKIASRRADGKLSISSADVD